MSDTDARTPGVPIKPPNAAYTLEAWLGRADDPRLELAGPGEYNELLQAAGRNWPAIDRLVREDAESTVDAEDVEKQLRDLARDRYFLTLTENNVETLLVLLVRAARGSFSGHVGPSAFASASRILGAWLRRVSVQAAPSWVAKQLPAIVDAACPALVARPQEGAAGSIVYLLGTAAAAPQCPPGVHSQCRDAVTRALQQQTSEVTFAAQFPDALAGVAYLIAGGPGLHADHLTTILGSLLRVWSTPGESFRSSPNHQLPPSLSQNSPEDPYTSTPKYAESSPGLHSDTPVPSAKTPRPPLPQALAVSRLLEYLGASLRNRAFSQDFGTRALGLADAKTVQNTVRAALSDGGRFGDPTRSAAVLGLGGFYRGLGGRRGDGFRHAPADWTRLVEQQEGLLSAAASAVVAEYGNARQRESSSGYVAHWSLCVALAAAQCDAVPGTPLTGDAAIPRCISYVLFGGLLSLDRFHRAVAALAAPELATREKAEMGKSEMGKGAGLHQELTRVVAELAARADGDAFKHVGVLARSLCDHCKAGAVSVRHQVLQEVKGFAVRLEQGQRVAARGLEVLGREEAAAAAATKILDAAFLTVTVCCEAILPEGPERPGSVPTDLVPVSVPAGFERILVSGVLEALSCVEFCRVPFAQYGQLVTRAVSLASASRGGAETLARIMPQYEDTVRFARDPAEPLLADNPRPSKAVDSAAGDSDSESESSSYGGGTGPGMYRDGETVEGAPSTSGRGRFDTSRTFAGGAAEPLQNTPPDIRDPATWARDKVRSSRIHFLLRVLGPCVENIGDKVFADEVLPTLLLYLLNPSAAVSRSAHALFVAFLETREAFHREGNPERNSETDRSGGTEVDRSAGFADGSFGAMLTDESNGGDGSSGSLEDLFWEDRPVTLAGLKPGLWQRLGFAPSVETVSRNGPPPEPSIPERAALFYVERALAGFPGLTSFEAFTAGVAAIVRNVPPGSPAIVLSLRRIAAAAKDLFERGVPYVATEGEGKGSSAGGQLTRLLVHLIPVVDIQVLTGLLHETEAVVLSVRDQTAQQAALAELYAVLAANEDYTRKAHCTVWYQHLAEKCVKAFRARVKEGRANAAAKRATVKPRDGAGGRSWPRTWGLSRGRQIPAGEAVT